MSATPGSASRHSHADDARCYHARGLPLCGYRAGPGPDVGSLLRCRRGSVHGLWCRFYRFEFGERVTGEEVPGHRLGEYAFQACNVTVDSAFLFTVLELLGTPLLDNQGVISCMGRASRSAKLWRRRARVAAPDLRSARTQGAYFCSRNPPRVWSVARAVTCLSCCRTACTSTPPMTCAMYFSAMSRAWATVKASARPT